MSEALPLCNAWTLTASTKPGGKYYAPPGFF